MADEPMVCPITEEACDLACTDCAIYKQAVKANQRVLRNWLLIVTVVAAGLLLYSHLKGAEIRSLEKRVEWLENLKQHQGIGR